MSELTPEQKHERDQRSAEYFVRESIAALTRSECDPAVIALAFVEVAGGLMRHDLTQNPTRLGMYAQSLKLFCDFVLDSVPNPREPWH